MGLSDAWLSQVSPSAAIAVGVLIRGTGPATSMEGRSFRRVATQPEIMLAVLTKRRNVRVSQREGDRYSTTVARLFGPIVVQATQPEVIR